LLQDRAAVAPGDHHVEEHEVDAVAAQDVHGGVATRRRVDLVSAPLQRDLEKSEDVGVVIDGQDRAHVLGVYDRSLIRWSHLRGSRISSMVGRLSGASHTGARASGPPSSSTARMKFSPNSYCCTFISMPEMR